MSQNNSPTWWGRFSLGVGQTAHWKIGPMRLAVQRLPHEWQIAYEQDKEIDPEPDEWHWNLDTLEINDLNYAHTGRYIISDTSETLWVKPVLADRPFITRPLTPLYIPPGEKTTIFVSSPLWTRIEVGDPPIKLQEVPLLRPSDTWFGPSTMEGELCYAGRTYARLDLENIPFRPHRAVTEVLMHNRAETQLLVERLSLPVSYLSLFAGVNGLLWTQAVTMTRTRDSGMAAFQIDKNPSGPAGREKPISHPRQQPEHNMVIRAFETIFH